MSSQLERLGILLTQFIDKLRAAGSEPSANDREEAFKCLYALDVMLKTARELGVDAPAGLPGPLFRVMHELAEIEEGRKSELLNPEP